jgi:hypothetical protein
VQLAPVAASPATGAPAGHPTDDTEHPGPPVVDDTEHPGPPVVDDTETFTSSVRAKLKSYVYLLVDPRTGRPFHVGHGGDDRCFDQVRAARAGRRYAADDEASEGRHDPVLDRIRQVESSGRPVRVEILRYGLDPDQAAMVGAAAHDVLGLPGTSAGGSHRRPVGEVRLLLTKRAKFKRPHQVVLLRVGPAGTDASYERARHGWRIGRRWVEVEAPRSPRWAALVVGELVDSVYRLDHWEASRPGVDGPVPAEAGSRAPDRYSFVGTRDAELERRYAGKSVAPYLGRVAQGSVSYVWCGPHWVNAAQ